MRTVFTNQDISHAWFHQTEGTEGRANSMFFEGDIIYSYGRHFPIARARVLPGVTLFTTDGYSISTAKHINHVRQAIPGTETVFTVPNVLANSKSEHKQNYSSLKLEIQAKLVKASRARTNKEFYLTEAQRLAAMLDKYSKTFKLGYKTIVLPVDLSEIKEAVDKERKRQAAKKKREQAAIQKENAEKIQSWIAGEHVNLPRMDKVYLRVTGDRIETTQYAHFPVDDARRAFKLIKRCKDAGKGWARNGETIELGHYRIDAIRANGTVIAGCHTVQYDEIERIAAIINA